MHKKKIAIVGAGAAGLSAAYYLQDKNDITVFEKSGRIGGHANPVLIKEGEKEFWLDTAFLIFNSGSYPLFSQFLKDNNVDSHTISMSIGIENQDLSYCVNKGINGVFADRRNIFSIKFLKFLKEIKSFQKNTNKTKNTDSSIKDYFKGSFFYYNFIRPLAESVWSIPSDDIDLMPAKMFLNFFSHHKILKNKENARWMALTGSSREYLQCWQDNYKGTLHLSLGVKTIEQSNKGTVLIDEKGDHHLFDDVIFALQADQTLKVLGNEASAEEKVYLGNWNYHGVKAYLHSDASMMPILKRSWGTWNIVRRGEESWITYNLNNIFPYKEMKGQYFVTLNAKPKEKILQEFDFRHPILNRDSTQTQEKLSSLNGIKGRYFCGSYFGNGFHEDAFRSSHRVAQMMEGGC